ncbi:NADH-quinone oxidoreductase subunit NuoF [Heliobacterium gestii]|uniref:NADH-quinone oxidoreductase subunit NuoF n=1 Tax=Heliomicrobium gestii TaxID=2699 RepID=A0A845L8J2_HELGE|nr:NADH-quinone oxidoreductase subunit NuoF [Heliomicrobium gestii]MBM7866145.1 NADH-quinone oxidoreductase subunit F [Heliomicrobium gestii]MZP42528.1 NADH-quinone oxidoreductase subunit NuoF [Heliomicrobium gestii]
MKSLMQSCCERCAHRPATPCKEYVRCRTEGPFCHDDDACRIARQRRIEAVEPSGQTGDQKEARGGFLRWRLLVCAGTGCIASGGRPVLEALQGAVAERGMAEDVQIALTGCHGFCEQGPIVVVEPGKTFYRRVSAADVPEIVEAHLVGGQVVERLLYRLPEGEVLESYPSIPFYARQHRIVLANCGHINPEDLGEYMARQGYRGFLQALAMDRSAVIAEVKRSGLRGRGGAGFLTGQKWEFTAGAAGEEKYIVCNADEGDPGAFMDRSVLEGDPHAVLEGMLVAGYAIGAQGGYIYVRAEYPLAIRRLQKAIAQAEACGLLGENILASGFSFHVHVKAGAGAFVCGEETALLTSIEGNRGMPRVRPPYPAIKGLWGKPTNINNVETFANIPHILRHGADWYANMGVGRSKGSKVFALTGKVNNTGLVEVPMGLSLREIIFAIGGGIQGGKAFKAVQIGGPSGGCLPESLLDTPVDYESLLEVGAMVGSGGLVVMDESTCMVDIARYFLNFTQQESCGKCAPCREGTKRMLEILTRITVGQGKGEDLAALEKLALVIKSTSLCGLGQSAPNPVLTTLRYFRDEYEAHISDRRCPAGLCAALLTYRIEGDKCRGCSLCARACPVGCISGKPREAYVIDESRCIKCGACLERCKFGAVIRR